MKSRPHRDLVLINAAGFLRSLGVGLIGVALGIYLFRVGLSSFMIGLVIATGLAGSYFSAVWSGMARSPTGHQAKRTTHSSPSEQDLTMGFRLRHYVKFDLEFVLHLYRASSHAHWSNAKIQLLQDGISPVASVGI